MKISDTGNKLYDFVVQGGKIIKGDITLYADNNNNTFAHISQYNWLLF